MIVHLHRPSATHFAAARTLRVLARVAFVSGDRRLAATRYAEAAIREAEGDERLVRELRASVRMITPGKRPGRKGHE